MCYLHADHFDRLYNLSDKYEWEKKCICCRTRRVKVEDYDGSKYETITDDSFCHFDPERNDTGWTIKWGWIAEVRME